jgi:hypothetical protein
VKLPQLVETSASSFACGATREEGGSRLTRLGRGLGTSWQPAGREAEVDDPPPPQAVSATAERFMASSVPSERAMDILRIRHAG